MSFFGKNIKKIRSVKGLSQQAFADLFSMKRGTLGAYEEGRSEPKIETIIKIANYFSISIDHILTQELTVNELLRFKGDLTTYTEDLTKDICTTIPYITDEVKKEYIEFYDNANFISELPTLKLPLDNSKEYRAYLVTNLKMTAKDRGFYPNDIVIGTKIDVTKLKAISAGSLALVLVANRLIFRRLYLNKDAIILRAEHKNIEDIHFKISEIRELWKVENVFFKRIPELSSNVESALLLMHNELIKMKDLIQSK